VLQGIVASGVAGRLATQGQLRRCYRRGQGKQVQGCRESRKDRKEANDHEGGTYLVAGLTSRCSGTRPLLRFRMNLNRHGWGRSPERETLGVIREVDRDDSSPLVLQIGLLPHTQRGEAS
jgi:hypothetical protein